MLYRNIILLIAIILFKIPTAYTEVKPEATKDDRQLVKIGVLLPLSGNVSFYGAGFKNSIQMALEQLGETSYRYELLFEDDGNSSVRAVSAFKKLVSDNDIGVVTSVTGSIAPVLAPLAVKENVIHFGVSSATDYADGKNNFNGWPAPAIPSQKLISEFKKRGIYRVALVGAEHPWPIAIFGELEKQAKQAGISIISTDTFVPGETNFRPIISKLKRESPDVAVLLSWTPELELFARQYHELKATFPLTSDFAFESSTEPALFNGSWFVNLAQPDAAYRSAFKQRFGYYPYSQMELGDVLLKLIVHAYEKTADKTRLPSTAELAKNLRAIKDLPTPLGPISIDQDGIISGRYALKTIKDGEIVQVED